MISRCLSISLLWQADFGEVRHRLPIGHVESPQYCGVAGCFDDDIEIDFIVSNRGMAFIGNGETVWCSLVFQHPTRTSELDLIISSSAAYFLCTSE